MLSESDVIPPKTSPDISKKDGKILKQLLSSEEWKDYFQSLSTATGFDLTIYDENNTPFLTTKENVFCELIKSFRGNGVECPASCNKFILESLKLNEPITYKCNSKIMNFSFPIKYSGEKVVIVGKKSFASYEDFLEFLKIARDNGINEIPITTSLNFTDENYVKNISHYVHKAINYLLNHLHEKHRLIEKIGHFTSLVGINILEKLSKDTESICRYIVDTIAFILSPVSVVILLMDNQTSKYKTTSATGKYKDTLMGLQFDPQNTLIQQILTTKVPVSPIVLEAEKYIMIETAGGTKSLYLFPIFFDNDMGGLIGVLDGQLSEEDIKIINALRDYIELALKNQALSITCDRKVDELLASVFNSTISLAPLLTWEQLLQTIVEKATQLLKAEQGSLMLLDQETTELFVKAKKSIDTIIKENMRMHKGEGIAGKVFETGEPLLVEDLEKDPRINQQNKPRYKTKSFVSIPLKIEDRVAGVLNISDKTTGEVFKENDLRLIQFFATNASIAIERSLLYKKTSELKELSITDPLTGIFNRRYLNSRLSEEVARFNRYKQPFSLLMIDIDGFKEYNDIFGHSTGDRVLKILADNIVASLRNTDVATRFGGDEFVLILSQTPKVDAINLANRIKENAENANIPHKEELPSKELTVSIGLTSYPDDASSITELLEKTDEALYLAKKSGRNKLVYL